MACLKKENVVFWTKNPAVDTWTITASSSAAGHPATEIQNSSRKLTWRSTVSTPSSITGTLASLPNLSMRGVSRRAGVCIIGHNFEQQTTIRIRFWRNSGVILLYDKIFSSDNFVNIDTQTRDLIKEIRPYQNRVIYIEEELTNIDKWQLDFSTSPGIPYFEIGRILISEAFQPSDNFYVENDQLGAVDSTKVSFSKGGDQFSDFGSKRRGIFLEPPASLLSQQEMTGWLRLVHVVGAREPIFIDVHPRVGGDFVFAETVEACLNLLKQVYGIANNNVRFGTRCANAISVSGSINIVEQA